MLYIIILMYNYVHIIIIICDQSQIIPQVGAEDVQFPSLPQVLVASPLRANPLSQL